MYPDPDRVRAGLQGYALHPDRQVWAWMVDGTAVSAAGLSVSARVPNCFTWARARTRVGRARRAPWCSP